jgi:hypothetical protein
MNFALEVPYNYIIQVFKKKHHVPNQTQRTKTNCFDAWVANLTSTYNIKNCIPQRKQENMSLCGPNQMKFCYDIPKNIK